MGFIEDKTAILNLIKAKSCKYAEKVNKETSTYADLVQKIIEFSITFDCDTSGYLQSLLAVVSDAVRMANGVYLDKVGGTINNPIVVVGGTPALININNEANHANLIVAGGAVVDRVFVSASTVLSYLEIIGASKVTTLEVANGSRVAAVHIGKCDTNISELTTIKRTGIITAVDPDQGAIFGGIECLPAIDACTVEVTGVNMSQIGGGYAVIAHTIPTPSVSRTVEVRRVGVLEWTLVSNDAGANLLISDLQELTQYEARVRNRCAANGPLSAGVSILFTTTEIFNKQT